MDANRSEVPVVPSIRKRKRQVARSVENRSGAVVNEAVSSEGGSEKETSAVIRYSKQAKRTNIFAVESQRGIHEKRTWVPFESSHSAATAEHDESAVAIDERAELKEKEARKTKLLGDIHDGKYHGLDAYKKYDAVEKFGPILAPSNIRSTTRFDYQPDICKDYKETGYCGYGDSCIFLHDRGDYKSGWELDKEWEENRFGKTSNDFDEEGEEAESDSVQEEVPFACYICRKPFALESQPVTTRCNHYFCYACAMKKCRTKCKICNAPTAGQFNMAEKVIERLKQKTTGSGGSESHSDSE